MPKFRTIQFDLRRYKIKSSRLKNINKRIQVQTKIELFRSIFCDKNKMENLLEFSDENQQEEFELVVVVSP